MNWQSSKVHPARFIAATSQASATFEASRARLNMLSPQNTRSKPTPYSPPTSRVAFPAFDRMGASRQMKRPVAGRDPLADPAFGMFGARRRAGFDHLREGFVAADAVFLLSQELGQRMGTVELVERDDRASPRFDPEDVRIVAVVGHGEDAAAIGEQQCFRWDDLGRRRVHAAILTFLCHRGNGLLADRGQAQTARTLPCTDLATRGLAMVGPCL